MKNPKNSKKTDWIWLMAGLTVTALFLIFSTSVYELLYYDGEFSNEMYNKNMYLVVAGLTSLVVWSTAILYYWIIDHFERWYHWLVAVVLVVVLSPVVVFSHCAGYFYDSNLDELISPLVNFNIINTIVALVLFFIVCLSVKHLSRHCSSTPF
ncbi:MAG: hypothetical protein IJU81_01275 [Bacteroidales bacterium]|nr:hypothetical protein [Bacteroidales bacterium]